MSDIDETKKPYKSPVANLSASKQWATRGLFCLVALLTVYAVYSARHSHKNKPHTEEGITSSRMIASAPQLVTEDTPIVTPSPIIRQDLASDRDADDEAEKLQRMRLVAPTTLFSSGNASATESDMNKPTQTKSSSPVGTSNDNNSRFMENVNTSYQSIKASRLQHPSTTLAQGSMIWGTLESRIQSDLPGMIRAEVSEDIYSEDGSQILVPKGSRVVGQYNSAIEQGQQRVFVVWQRLIRPDHIDIALLSPGTDQLGGAGFQADTINQHFFEQFGTAFLLSMIGAGASNVGVHSGDQFNSASSYRESLANSFAQTAQNNLNQIGVIKRTLTVNQGAAISIFVAQDLDFYDQLTR